MIRNVMRRCKLMQHIAVIGAILGVQLAYGADQTGLTIGIMPTFNAGNDTFGDVFSQHLGLRLFQQLRGEATKAVLLNPGGLYDPGDDGWLLDYGKKSGADLLVITTLMKTEMPEKGDGTIAVQTEIMDLKTGSRSGPWKSTVQIRKRDAHLDYGANWRGYEFGFPSRVFEKQPLGKAMLAIGDQVRSQVLLAIYTNGAAVASKQNPVTSGGPCDVTLKLLYTSKHAASKSYMLFVDGRDESLGAKDGVALLHQKFGPMLLQWSVNDAPYRMPTQELYQAATNVDCSRPERQLNIEIGAAGEALLVWK